MDDNKILEAIERYLAGEMSAEERAYFESLRQSSPEIDQLVVEHSHLLQQIENYENVRRFKNVLNETHLQLAEEGSIQAPKLKGKAKVVYLFNRYKRTAAIAASIAGITALSFSALVWSVSPTKPANNKDIENLNRDIHILNKKVTQVADQNDVLQKQITNVATSEATKPAREYNSGGTGFLVDPKGFMVTSYHVVEGAKYIAVQNNSGKDLQAKVIYQDQKRDIAILKIVDTAFKAPAAIPYAVKRSGADIAEPVFSLGYPRNDIVYGEGYLSALTGFNGDTLSLQISINANHGNSGSPILNHNGEIIGVLSGRQTSAEGAVFAIRSKYIYDALNSLRKEDTSYHNVKLPATSSLRGTDRTQQVKKIADCVYMVKVNSN